MSKKTIAFRADRSKKTGFGHFVRSLALANHLKNDFECYFASYDEDIKDVEVEKHEEYLRQLVQIGILPILLFENSREENDEAFLRYLDNNGIDIVVLDNYYYDAEYQQKIRNLGCKVVCIDDVPSRHMACDLLITGSPLNRSDFSLEPYTEFVSGIEWTFLRDEFLVPMKLRNTKSEPAEVVIAMGGSDAFNLTDKMISIIGNCMPTAKIHVIAGSLVKINSQNQNRVIRHQNLSASELVTLFDKVDLGIFPSSTIAIEAASRKLPIIVGYNTANQMALYENGVKKKLFVPLGNLLDSANLIVARLTEIIGSIPLAPPVIDFSKQKQDTISLFKRL